MKIKETSLNQIEDLVSFSSQFFVPTRKDGVFDALKFCQKFEETGILKIFVSKIKNKNIGYISILLHPEKKTLDITPMFILPKFSGKGYGKTQVEFILRYALKNNYQIIETKTWGENYGSKRIFESLGFVKIKEIKNDRINEDSSIFYKKLLK